MKHPFRFKHILICLLLIAPVAVAQTTGTIAGTVSDQTGGVLPGATVEVSSPALQGTRVATTGADGRYRFVAVPPGNYRVTATFSGFGAVQKNATVQLDGTATVNLQMQLAAAEKVTVTGEAPIVDVTSTTTGTNYTSNVMKGLPLQRNYADIVRAQPGVQTDTGETQGRSLALSIYGSTSAENLWIIDGINTTNVIKGLQGKALNTEFIQEVEVKTGGYQAEYGRNTGGVVNVITKSGGNEFHGDAFGYFDNENMLADRERKETPAHSQRGDVRAGTLTDKIERRDFGAGLGGFFIKDRLWFYAAYNRVETDQEYHPTAGIRANESFPIEFRSDLYSGKLTANLFQGTTLVGTIIADPQENVGALLTPNSRDPNTYLATRELGGTDWAARLNQLFGSFGILTLQYSFHEDSFELKPGRRDLARVTDLTPALTRDPGVVTGGIGLVFGPTANNASERDLYGGSFTAYLGSHEFKVGGDFQDDVTFGSTFRTGNQGLTIRPCLNPTPGTSFCDLSKAPLHPIPFGARAGERVPVFYQHSAIVRSPMDLTSIDAPFETPTERWGAFIQDQWRILPNLTVNLGVRYDSEDIIRGDGVTAFKLKDQWAHRGGFVWDFIGDGTSKLYGSTGRFFYALPTDLNVRVFTANTFLTTFNYSPTDIVQDPAAPRRRLIQGGSGEGEPVDPGIEAAYNEEYTFGVEKALDPTLSVGLKGTYRSLGRTVEDRCDLDYNDPLAKGSTCALFNPGGSGPAARGEIKVCNESANPTDPNRGVCGLPGIAVPEAKRIFRGVELTARKAFGQRLWAQASYLYSKLVGNYSGAIRVASGQTDPGINADYDYNEFLRNAYGRLELDRPHQFRLDGVWNAPFGLSVGLQTYLRSGRPTSREGFYNNFYTTELFLDQRGTNGRTPTDYEANLSLAYNWNIGRVTVTPVLYVFNVLDRQRATSVSEPFNPSASFVTRTGSPFRGQAGVEPPFAGSTPTTAQRRPDGTYCTSDGTFGGTPLSSPCSDNPDYRKITGRTAPRLFRAALKITF